MARFSLCYERSSLASGATIAGRGLFLLALMAFWLGTRVATFDQVTFLGTALIVDLVLLVQGRKVLR